MSSERPRKPFSLAPDRTSFAVSDLKQARDQSLSFDKAKPSQARQPEQTTRDKDNAQPRPKPPVHIDNPRLAPPGMSGIRPSLNPPAREQNNAPSKRTSLGRELGKPSDINKEFKSLAGPSQGKDRGVDR